MTEKVASLAHGEVDVLILQALVRKLIEKGVLSPDDVKALLFEAATRLDPVGSELTPRPHHCPGGLGARIPRKVTNGFGLRRQRRSSISQPQKPNLRRWRFHDDDTRQAF